MSKQTNSKIDYIELETIMKKESNNNTCGIIIDTANPYKSLDSHQFLTKVKIIDSQINHNNKKLKYDFVQVFIYHSELKDAPKIHNIGDYLSLRNFKFEESKFNTNELYAKFTYESEWAVIPDNNLKEDMDLKNISSNKNFKNKNAILYIKKNLSKFKIAHFSKYSLEEMNWFHRPFPKDKLNKNCLVKQNDIDMLMKIIDIKIFEVEEYIYYKICFADKNCNLYSSELRSNIDFLESGSCYKLRSINIYHKENEKKVEFRSYSRIIKIPDSFKDSKILKEKNKNTTYKGDLEKLFLEDLHLNKLKPENNTKENWVVYYYEEINESFDNNFIDNNLRSQILNKHNNLKKIKSNFSKELKSKSNLLRINSKVSNLKHKSFKDCFKIYCSNDKKYYNLSQYSSLKKKNLVVSIVNSFQIVECNEDIQIDSLDGNPSFLFDKLVKLPNYKDINSWASLDSNIIKELNKALKNFGSNNDVYEFVIEKNKNWRLIDTMLS